MKTDSFLKFENALLHRENSCPPIWMMRQAGRYQQSYRSMKKSWTFEQMCKLPGLAADVAMLPINEFDFDVAILFSDILFHLEGLGLPLTFSPGPKFEWHLDEDNWSKHKDIDKAVDFLKFQSKALQQTREQLGSKKALVGFVGGPWTVLNYALGNKKSSDDFKHMYLKTVLVPLLRASIKKQLEAGADCVMIFDSGLKNIRKKYFDNDYCELLKELQSAGTTAYYSRTLPTNSLQKVIDINFAGIGIDSKQNLNKTLQKASKGFVQGNFDETLLLLDSQTKLEKEIHKWLETVEDTTGWVCGLGHGILKETPPKNVSLFVKTVRNYFN